MQIRRRREHIVVAIPTRQTGTEPVVDAVFFNQDRAFIAGPVIRAPQANHIFDDGQVIIGKTIDVRAVRPILAQNVPDSILILENTDVARFITAELHRVQKLEWSGRRVRDRGADMRISVIAFAVDMQIHHILSRLWASHDLRTLDDTLRTGDGTVFPDFQHRPLIAPRHEIRG